MLDQVISTSEGLYRDENNHVDLDLSNFIRVHQLRGTTISDELRSINTSRLNNTRSQCSNIDRRSEMPPVRNQDSTGWCYAFAAADLVSHRTGRNISAFDIAVRYNQHINEQVFNHAIRSLNEDSNYGISPLRLDIDAERFNQQVSLLELIMERNGGFSAIAVEQRIPQGFCLESDMPSDNYAFTRIGNVLSQFSRLHQQSLQRQDNRNAMEMAQAFCLENRNSMSVFPGTLVSDIAEAIEAMTVPQFFQELVDRQCQNRIPFNEVPTSMSASSSRYSSPLVDELNRVMDSGQIVQIDYDVGLIERAGRQEAHASSIVARRWNEETLSCDYLIRNSWGEGCGLYKPQYQCEAGHVWVPRGDLQQELSKITYFPLNN